MIIVSQLRNSITNFDNITDIELKEYENKSWIIKCYTIDDKYINLAIYKTEERAKEVLQEIIKTNSNFGYYKCVNESERDGLNPFMKTKYKFFDVYEMPEE